MNIENNNVELDIAAEKLALNSLIEENIDEEPRAIIESISENLNNQIELNSHVDSADVMAEVMQSPQVISQVINNEETITKSDLENAKKDIENSLKPVFDQMNENISSMSTTDRNPKRFTEQRPTYSLDGLIFSDRMTQITNPPEWL
jgi:hypothetical protein